MKKTIVIMETKKERIIITYTKGRTRMGTYLQKRTLFGWKTVMSVMGFDGQITIPKEYIRSSMWDKRWNTTLDNLHSFFPFNEVPRTNYVEKPIWYPRVLRNDLDAYCKTNKFTLMRPDHYVVNMAITPLYSFQLLPNFPHGMNVVVSNRSSKQLLTTFYGSHLHGLTERTINMTLREPEPLLSLLLSAVPETSIAYGPLE